MLIGSSPGDLLGGIGASVVVVHFVLFLAIAYVSRPAARTRTRGDRSVEALRQRGPPPMNGEEGHQLTEYAERGAPTPDVSSLSESRRSMLGMGHERAWSGSSISDDELGPERAQQ